MQIQCWIKDSNNKEIEEKLLWCARETEVDHRTVWLGPPVLIFKTLPVFMTLILPSVCHSCMCDDKKKGCLLSSIWYHDYATFLSFICNDYSIEIQKKRGGVEVEWPGIYYASQVYWRTFLCVPFLWSQNKGVGLNNSKVHSVF